MKVSASMACHDIAIHKNMKIPRCEKLSECVIFAQVLHFFPYFLNSNFQKFDQKIGNCEIFLKFFSTAAKIVGGPFPIGT